jgi:hypothetical protein
MKMTPFKKSDSANLTEIADRLRELREHASALLGEVPTAPRRPAPVAAIQRSENPTARGPKRP